MSADRRVDHERRGVVDEVDRLSARVLWSFVGLLVSVAVLAASPLVIFLLFSGVK